MGNHWPWLVVLVAAALLIFGPSRLPELGGALGRGIREFRKASQELHDEVTKPADSEPAPTPTAAPTAPESKPPTA